VSRAQFFAMNGDQCVFRASTHTSRARQFGFGATGETSHQLLCCKIRAFDSRYKVIMFYVGRKYPHLASHKKDAGHTTGPSGLRYFFAFERNALHPSASTHREAEVRVPLITSPCYQCICPTKVPEPEQYVCTSLRVTLGTEETSQPSAVRTTTTCTVRYVATAARSHLHTYSWE